VIVQEIVIQGGMEQGDHFDDEIYQKRWNKDVDVGHAPIVMNRNPFPMICDSAQPFYSQYAAARYERQ